MTGVRDCINSGVGLFFSDRLDKGLYGDTDVLIMK